MFIVVKENSNGTVKKYTVSQKVMEAAAAILLVLTVGVVSKFVLDSIAIGNARKEIINQTITINDLTDENEALGAQFHTDG